MCMRPDAQFDRKESMTPIKGQSGICNPTPECKRCRAEFPSRPPGTLEPDHHPSEQPRRDHLRPMLREVHVPLAGDLHGIIRGRASRADESGGGDPPLRAGDAVQSFAKYGLDIGAPANVSDT